MPQIPFHGLGSDRVPQLPLRLSQDQVLGRLGLAELANFKLLVGSCLHFGGQLRSDWDGHHVYGGLDQEGCF